MQFYGIDYYLEQKYFVEKTAFIDAIKNALEYIKNVKLENFTINFDDENIFVEINIYINKKASLYNVITEIQEEIEDSIYSLTDITPTNIKIDVKGTF